MRIRASNSMFFLHAACLVSCESALAAAFEGRATASSWKFKIELLCRRSWSAWETGSPDNQLGASCEKEAA
jgi:hypothetical protein